MEHTIGRLTVEPDYLVGFRGGHPVIVPVASALAGLALPTYAEMVELRRQVLQPGNVTVSTTAGTTIKAGAGAFYGFIVQAKGTSPTLTIYDNTSGSGSALIPALNGTSAVGDFPALNIGETWFAGSASYPIPIAFANGMHVVIGGTGTTTISFLVR